jgi:hypothetical protein
MIHRQAKLTADEMKHLTQLDMSIQHWSIQHTQMALQAREMLENIAGLNQARNQAMDRALMEAQIDPKSIKQIQVAADGTIHCICAPPPPPVAAPGEHALTKTDKGVSCAKCGVTKEPSQAWSEPCKDAPAQAAPAVQNGAAAVAPPPAPAAEAPKPVAPSS